MMFVVMAPAIGRADTAPAAVSPKTQLSRHVAGVAAQIRRLRKNASPDIFATFDGSVGHVRCAPRDTPVAIYCEAQSGAAEPSLAAKLTPALVAELHGAGYADPGKTPNYSKTYAADQFENAEIARELLTILHDVYGYDPSTKLQVTTENGPN
jgi:hypothetical protein